MTNEQSIVKALETKLRNRYLAEKGNVDLDFIESALRDTIEELRGRDVPETLADKLPNVLPSEKQVLNQVTSEAVERARRGLYGVMSELIMNPEFDPDGFISAIVYWYEFQQLAKAYGKKLFYVKPKPKKEN